MKRFFFLAFYITLFQANLSMGQQFKKALKVNLTSPLLKNYGIDFEHNLTKNISININGQIRPNSQIPLKNFLIQKDILNDEPEIHALKINTVNVTPEIRFYMSKRGYGHGFYFAPFYRFSKFGVTDFNSSTESGIDLVMKGNGMAHGGGFSLGAQWHLGNRFVLNWTILAPHYGTQTSKLQNINTLSLNSTQQQEVYDYLIIDDEFILNSESIEVSESNFNAKYAGPWFGVRGNLSLGFRF